MKTYYAITSGSGKSYGITAITDDEERAKNIKKAYDDNTHKTHYIERFYDGGAINEISFFVCANTDGTFDVCPQPFCLGKKWFDKIRERNESETTEYSVDVFATNKDHAIQIAKNLWEKYKSEKVSK